MTEIKEFLLENEYEQSEEGYGYILTVEEMADLLSRYAAIKVAESIENNQ